MRVLLADDHEVVRLGLKSLLSRYPDLEVVAEAATGEEAVQKALELIPDIVIMDVRMPGGSGIEACREIRSANDNINVIMLTSYADQEALESSILAGAAGYVLKEIGSDDLVQNIRKAHAGEKILLPEQISDAVSGIKKRFEQMRKASELTEQEEKILSLLAEGKTNKQIAQEIFLSEKTVRNYVSNILTKLGLSNRAEAAAYAVRRSFSVISKDWDI
ncbi:MAG: response regulator transcription factor [Firmicutes bacterium]|nr:response regulator transcription factor [Bacillota bacterium]